MHAYKRDYNTTTCIQNEKFLWPHGHALVNINISMIIKVHLQIIIKMHKNIKFFVKILCLPSHLGLSHSTWPRPYKLRISVEGDGVKGAGAEVRTDGACDAVEQSLTTRMDTNERLRGNIHFYSTCYDKI